ncbi:unnamed protein product [Cylindrotheca closterium]|uniref:EGF-like domain-containing protein n=1 Tax=Cylindrotheca closterium TaxID=2856 RepID=A0AAD2CVW1_9STRA|nr:unnamed protein product [Cylindrotheca closterium]
MDAWSLAMKDESKSHVEDSNNKSESDDTLVQLLIERVDHVETKVQHSEAEIKKLQRRLSIAEKRISPLDNNHLPWRRIGNEEEDDLSVSRCEEGEFNDSDIKAEEEYQLPRDVYSIVSSWEFNSRPFWISLLVIAVQIVLLALLLTDQTQGTAEADVVVFPVNVPTIVHLAQALATIIAIMDQDDLRSAIEAYFDGLPTRFKGDDGFQRMTKAQWNFSCFIRFFQGFLSVLASFVLAVQSQTVFDVLLNFLGVKFVSELDDLAFNLGQLGYFGNQCEHAAKCIAEAKFQQDNRNRVDESSWSRAWFYKYAHVIGIFGVLGLLLGLFFYAIIWQNTGRLAAQVIKLEVAEGAIPFAALFNGCYGADRKGPKYDRRLPYRQIGFEETGGNFGFCSDIGGEQAWTFSIGSSSDPCHDWQGRTSPTTTYDILELADNTQWFSIDGISLGSLQISRVLNPTSECERFIIDNSAEICEQLTVEGSIDANQEVPRSTFFSKAMVNSKEATAFTYEALAHPIYVGASSTPQSFDLIFFTGQSWVLTDKLKSKASGNDLSMQEYMDNDPEFLSILNATISVGGNVSLVTGSTIGTPNSHTPLGLRWFRMREQDPRVPYNYPTADSSRPVEMVVECATCNNSTNPCGYGGVCRANQTCDCINGGYGALCHQLPLGDAFCNPYFNTEYYDYDGGDCCGGSCRGPQCGLGGLSFAFGLDSQAQGIDEFNILGYEFCEDPKMASVTIELRDFEILDSEEWNAIVGFSDPFCSTATVNVRCDGITYLHVPQHILINETNCKRSYAETIRVPFGSRCELSTSAICLGVICLDHNIAIYYGPDTTSVPIRSGSVRSDTQLSFGVPSKCLTEILSGRNFSIFDLSTEQGTAANVLSNDELSEFLCNDNSVAENQGFVLERFALAVFNASVHFNSSNWEPYQCHGFGIPAFHTACSFFSITSLELEADAVTQVGTIPTELYLLTRLNNLVLRGNSFTGTIPTTLGLLSDLGGLELWDNNLSGRIPSELGALTKLSALALASNRLTGPIPKEILGLQLTGLWIDDNEITGTVSSLFGAMPLVTLSLSVNRFSGTLPQTLFNISTLSSFNLAYNRITGSIPEVGDLNLNTLWLNDNQMTGSVPADLTVLGNCSLANNNFTDGTAPANCAV